MKLVSGLLIFILFIIVLAVILAMRQKEGMDGFGVISALNNYNNDYQFVPGSPEGRSPLYTVPHHLIL
jgi:hypothetical protein